MEKKGPIKRQRKKRVAVRASKSTTGHLID